MHNLTQAVNRHNADATSSRISAPCVTQAPTSHNADEHLWTSMHGLTKAFKRHNTDATLSSKHPCTTQVIASHRRNKMWRVLDCGPSPFCFFGPKMGSKADIHNVFSDSTFQKRWRSKGTKTESTPSIKFRKGGASSLWFIPGRRPHRIKYRSCATLNLFCTDADLEGTSAPINTMFAKCKVRIPVHYCMSIFSLAEIGSQHASNTKPNFKTRQPENR